MEKIMLLVIDIGNTNMAFGVFKGDHLEQTWRIATSQVKTSDEYGLIFSQLLSCNGLAPRQISDIIIGSVVPSVMSTIEAACERYLGIIPMVVGQGTKTGLEIRYDNPKEIGADRIINSVAGVKKYGSPLIIVDIGTAITFDTISNEGAFIGGAIAPGIGIASEALFQRASKLPRVELMPPKRVVGKTTVEAMQSGIVLGYIGMIDYIVECIMQEQGWTKDTVRVIGTGGFSKLIASQSRYIEEVDKMITLEGLKIIYERTKAAQ